MAAENVNQVFDTVLAFSAAAAAYRINGLYVKASHDRWEGNVAVEHIYANRELVLQFLANTSKITQEDRDLAEKIIAHFNAYSFKLLRNDVLSDMDSKYLSMASKDTVSRVHLGLIAYAPEAYFKSVQYQQEQNQLDNCVRGYLAPVGSPVTGELTITRVIYSKNWQCYFVNAVTDDNYAVSFVIKTPIELGRQFKFRARVREHRDNVTRLNYVKLKQ